MLTRIRNACRAGHPFTTCPASRLKLSVAKVLQAEGFLSAVEEVAEESGHRSLRIDVRYGDDGKPIMDGIRRISTPGRRVYCGAQEIPKVRNGLGVAVVSTPKGVLSDRAARAESVGGELLCEVW